MTSRGTSASVVRNASIVAMFGAIIPQPLAMPPTVKVEPCDHDLLGLVIRGQDAARRIVRRRRRDSFFASFGVCVRRSAPSEAACR